MSRHPDPFSAFAAWSEFAAAYAQMNLAAGEIILRRTQRMASGSMTMPEAMAMVMEKSAAFASAAERASVAAVGGGDAIKIATAALGPYGVKTRSNVRKLRR